MKKVLGVTGVDFNSSELFILYRYLWYPGTTDRYYCCGEGKVVLLTTCINLVLHAYTHMCEAKL